MRCFLLFLSNCCHAAWDLWECLWITSLVKHLSCSHFYFSSLVPLPLTAKWFCHHPGAKADVKQAAGLLSSGYLAQHVLSCQGQNGHEDPKRERKFLDRHIFFLCFFLFNYMRKLLSSDCACFLFMNAWIRVTVYNCGHAKEYFPAFSLCFFCTRFLYVSSRDFSR